MFSVKPARVSFAYYDTNTTTFLTYEAIILL
nr:MAG TPA: hypothetical protein [Caudoviricetes sp.]